jgi:hypothetical protein
MDAQTDMQTSTLGVPFSTDSFKIAGPTHQSKYIPSYKQTSGNKSHGGQ